MQELLAKEAIRKHGMSHRGRAFIIVLLFLTNGRVRSHDSEVVRDQRVPFVYWNVVHWVVTISAGHAAR